MVQAGELAAPHEVPADEGVVGDVGEGQGPGCRPGGSEDGDDGDAEGSGGLGRGDPVGQWQEGGSQGYGDDEW